MGLLAGAVLLAMALHEPEPRVDLLPPRSEDAAFSEATGRALQHISRQPDRRGQLSGTAEEFNGLFRLLGRSNPDAVGRVGLENGAVRLDLSLRLPQTAWLGWINVSAIIPPYRGLPEPRALQVGAVPLPPGPIMGLASRALERRFGAGAAAELLGTLPELAIEDERIVVGFAFPEGTDRRVSRAGLAEVFANDMPSRDEVMDAIRMLQAGVSAGDLPVRGSYLPWLVAVLDWSADAVETGRSPARALTAGFMALNHLCGSVHFRAALLPPRPRGAPRFDASGPGCGETGLRGRVDLRRHFTTAATIKLITDRNMAITAGEAKELFDMLHGGFDFTDVAANNSGIRLAELLSRADAAKIAAVRAAIRSEDDVIVALDGLPGVMPRAAFEARFGEVDSPAYRDMMTEIEARIDALPVHAEGRDG